MDWRTFWEEYPRRYGESEFRKQVGRTADGGVPTAETEIGQVVEEVVRRLELRADDRLLDLCCGNGYLTVRLAEVAREVVGVDFSEPMLEVARRFHTAPAVTYREGSALDLGSALGDARPFHKVCLLESLHYFVPRQLGRLLEELLRWTTDDARIYLSGVPDAERKDAFFDTPERRREHERRKAAGTDAMGYWWTAAEIEERAEALGLRCEILPQHPALHTAYYRFDAVLSRS